MTIVRAGIVIPELIEPSLVIAGIINKIGFKPFAPWDAVLFIGGYKGDTDVQDVGVDGDLCNLMPMGTGIATTTHNVSILAPDADGIYQEYGIDKPVWAGGIVDLDPEKLWWPDLVVTVGSPANLGNFRLIYSDSSTYRVKTIHTNGSVTISDSIASGVNISYRPEDGASVNVYTGTTEFVSYIYIYSTKLNGTIPELNFPNLLRIHINDNHFTGNIPSFSNCPITQYFVMDTNSLTGSIPSLISNPQIRRLYLYNNQLSGDIPDLSSLLAADRIYLYSNQLTGYVGGWPNKAFDFNASDNALTETAVNLILTEADTYGIATGTSININGGTNAAPTGSGITAKNNLIANGATVTTN